MVDHINVTKTYLPNKKKYLDYVEKIFASGWITNEGALVRELEGRLVEHLGVRNLVLVENGTLALEIAYKLLKLKGEVITTPFTFIATSSSQVASGLRPVFSDIDARTFNLDPAKIEAAITDQTSAIVPVHIFGNACEVLEIEKVADRHHLKVIYDAAHAFGVKYKGQSLLNRGDISTISFHATKLFHTVEGGALVINDDETAEEARLMINFGISSPETIRGMGINAKMNEFEAAMGLCVLDDIDLIMEQRQEISERYTVSLKDCVGFQTQNPDSTRNYNYFPVIFKSEEQALYIQKKLNENGVFPRRYFYPSLDTVDYLRTDSVMSVSRDIASRILCLPMYPGLKKEEQMLIIGTVKEGLRF